MSNNLPSRKQIRLYNYDYSARGYYFITICTKDRQRMLSEIRRGGVLLRPIGEIINNEINNLAQRYHIEINPYIIMPDHLHLIIKINKRAEQSPAPTIGDIICTLKSLTTKIANKHDNCPGRIIWQRTYYDRILRNEDEYLQAAEYILNNPMKWEYEHNTTVH